ncbi:MAG: adenosylmethionine decarboxylase [Myxococcales bacterium]|nr:adenosylmethionine decarboxylase [Myxococcales bacterium]|tara:strand:- start:359 stop:757 length:399 start_codon:yes stop_codon:yes gene_type:complete
MANALGRHLLCEFYDCSTTVLNDAAKVQHYMHRAAECMGATIVEEVFHEFSPYGVSGVVVIAESHIAIHTWPEHGYAAVDIFTCGAEMEPRRGIELLVEFFSAGNHSVREIARGVLESQNPPKAIGDGEAWR